MDWEVRQLGEVAKISSGGTPSRSHPEFWNGSIPWVTTSQIDYRVIYDSDEKITEEGLSRSASRLYSKGTLLMAMYGQGVTRGRVGILGIEAAINQACAAIQPSSALRTSFLFHYASLAYGHIRKVAHGGNQANLSGELIASVHVPIPTVDEQDNISAVLDSWDSIIGVCEDLLDAKQQLKSGLMQKLLTGECRFPEFGKRGNGGSNGWKDYHLGDLFDERVEIGRGDLPLLSITGDRGVVNRDDLDKKDTSNADKAKYLRITPGDIGYNTMRMWQGVSALSELEGIISPAYTVCIPKSGKIDGKFAAYLFKFQPIVHRFWRYSQGMVNDTLNLKFHNFAEVRVKIPALDEQREIAALLSGCDKEIVLLESELEDLRDQKKGLMQKLLTGKIRVRV